MKKASIAAQEAAKERQRKKEVRARYTEAAVMADGSRREVARYLRAAADAIEDGASSGCTGSASKCRGRWITNC
jgi:hypothetical protein